jgi:hypothetical protein
MPSNVTREDVVERPNKYGTFDDDLDILADMLNGKEPAKPSRFDQRSTKDPVPTVVSQEAERQLDESFWRQVNSESKYGQ